MVQPSWLEQEVDIKSVVRVLCTTLFDWPGEAGSHIALQAKAFELFFGGIVPLHQLDH